MILNYVCMFYHSIHGIKIFVVPLLIVDSLVYQVEARINEESERVKHYLDPSTKEPIIKVPKIFSAVEEK